MTCTPFTPGWLSAAEVSMETNLCVRNRGIHEAGVEHAGQLHVDGVAGAAGHLGMAVPALGRFADEFEVLVDGQHGRL